MKVRGTFCRFKFKSKVKMSCEQKRTTAYSNHLRWRMVYVVEMQHKSYRQVAMNLAVDLSTVCRTISLFNESGNVDKRKYPPNKGTTVLTEMDKLIIMETERGQR